MQPKSPSAPDTSSLFAPSSGCDFTLEHARTRASSEGRSMESSWKAPFLLLWLIVNLPFVSYMMWRALTDLLHKIVGDKPDVATVENTATRLPLDDPAPVLAFDGKEFCFTGKFVFGPRSHCEEAIRVHGATTHKNVRRWTDYVVIGSLASRDWAHATHGRKIEKALEMKKQGLSCSIVSEEHWTASL